MSAVKPDVIDARVYRIKVDGDDVITNTHVIMFRIPNFGLLNNPTHAVVSKHGINQ
jgi:hypothetical protein